MTEDSIRYDLIVQEALRDAVRRIMAGVARDGLPGDHHFFITFKTSAPGVQLSDRMRQEYPDEMTIVLQHQFWDMSVDNDHFEVGLSFRNIPEKLSIPFAAMIGFADPSVQFALRFETDAGAEPAEPAEPGNDTSGTSKPGTLALHTDPAETSDPAFLAAQRDHKDQGEARGNRNANRSKREHSAAVAEGENEPADDSGEGDTNVVSIDAFRKKT